VGVGWGTRKAYTFRSDGVGKEVEKPESGKVKGFP